MKGIGNKMSSSTYSGVKYKINENDWVVDTSVPAHVTTVGEFITYLGTIDSAADIDNESLINVNLQGSNRNTTLSSLSESDQRCWITFQRNNKVGG